MNKKRKIVSHEPCGQLGQVFNFSQDDLSANRAGFMSRAQQLELDFTERRWFGWIFNYPPLKWMRVCEVIRATGKIKTRNFSQRVVHAGTGRSGAAHQIILEKRSIQFLCNDGDGLGFYVTEKQYNSLPQNIEMTIYYDPESNRIVSVEPPYDRQD